MGFYDGMLKTASRLIKKYGGTFSYTQVAASNYDPTDRTQSATDTTYSIRGVRTKTKQAFIEGTLVEKGDARFLLDAKALLFTPRQGDRLLIGGDTFFVDSIQAVAPSGAKVVLYILVLRAG